jgi:hypothetical protein
MYTCIFARPIQNSCHKESFLYFNTRISIYYYPNFAVLNIELLLHILAGTHILNDSIAPWDTHP